MYAYVCMYELSHIFWDGDEWVQLVSIASEDITAKAEEYLDKAKTAWAENESKPTTLLIAGGAVTTLVVPVVREAFARLLRSTRPQKKTKSSSHI